MRRLLRRGFDAKGVARDRTVNVVARLTHHGIVLIGLGIALDTIGIDLGALFAAGAIFAVGIGFAMQSIAQNFVSGVILLMERAVSVVDVLKVDRRGVRAEEMGIRSTIVERRMKNTLNCPRPWEPI